MRQQHRQQAEVENLKRQMVFQKEEMEHKIIQLKSARKIQVARHVYVCAYVPHACVCVCVCVLCVCVCVCVFVCVCVCVCVRVINERTRARVRTSVPVPVFA